MKITLECLMKVLCANTHILIIRSSDIAHENMVVFKISNGQDYLYWDQEFKMIVRHPVNGRSWITPRWKELLSGIIEQNVLPTRGVGRTSGEVIDT